MTPKIAARAGNGEAGKHSDGDNDKGIEESKSEMPVVDPASPAVEPNPS